MKVGKQQSLTDIGYGNRKRKTKRDEFLGTMDEVIPWDEWIELVEPHYPEGKRGRPPRGAETMLRMYLLANWFNLSDEGVEDAIYDSYAFRQFMRVDFLGDSQVPDATTLCKFRKTLNENGITKLLFDTTKIFLERYGKMMRGGTIVDETIVEAPASTKNVDKRREIQADSHLSRIDCRTNTRNRHRWKTLAPTFDWDRHVEYQKSRVRSKVEYVFLIIKRLFGYRKVRYRGLEKNRTHAFILGACANLFMLAQSGWFMVNGVA